MCELEELEDEVLLSRIASQDKAAFAELFRRYAVRIKAFMLRGGVALEHADVIAQVVMVSVWRRADRFYPEKASAPTWIFAIARNRRIDLVRRQSRPAPDPQDPLFQPDPEPGGREAVTVKETQAVIREGLDSLAPEQREVLFAAFYEALSHGEIATKLDLPLGTVKSRIRLAFKHLRAKLGDEMLEGLKDE